MLPLLCCHPRLAGSIAHTSTLHDLPAYTPAQPHTSFSTTLPHVHHPCRIYHRGSGEHHQVALPSYPHFEGHSLELLDTCEEGELSALERLQAEREDDAMWKDFREKLLANLGLVGRCCWLGLTAAGAARDDWGGWWLLWCCLLGHMPCRHALLSTLHHLPWRSARSDAAAAVLPSAKLTPAPAPAPAPPLLQVGEELWHTQGHARPQRPKDGWSLVVHSQGPRHQRRPTYVAMPDGRQRTLTDSEAFLERLRTRKRNAKFMPT